MKEMSLLEMVGRTPVPVPWDEGEKIPWNDPDFSARMLKEHLTQDHDAASRRSENIDLAVEWIDRKFLKGEPTRILDLACGPGLYATRFARLGNACVGIDFGPASIRHARKLAEEEGLNCEFVEEDLRKADFGSGFDLAMLIFGEFNVFKVEEAELILRKARAALDEGGWLILEPHTFAAVRKAGEKGPFWYSPKSGLFLDAPHLYLEENFWDEESRVATTRYFVVEAENGNVKRWAASMQGYSDEEYRALLERCGFGQVQFLPSLIGREDDPQREEFFVLAARK